MKILYCLKYSKQKVSSPFCVASLYGVFVAILLQVVAINTVFACMAFEKYAIHASALKCSNEENHAYAEWQIGPLGGEPDIIISTYEENMEDFQVIEAGGIDYKSYDADFVNFLSNAMAEITLNDPSGFFSIALPGEEYGNSILVEIGPQMYETIWVKYEPTTAGPHYATISHIADGMTEPRTLAIQGNTPEALPVGLVSFNGRLERESMVLDWVTASETNNSHFEVEMMEDPKKGFVYVGRLNSKAVNSTLRQHYNFRYTYPSGAAYCYFRLKQVGIDQSFTYSPTIAIKTQGLAKVRLQAAPNPLTPISQLSITAPVAGLIQIIITDIQGTPVFRQEVAVQKGENKLGLPLKSGLPAGIYLLSATSGTGVSHLRLVKN